VSSTPRIDAAVTRSELVGHALDTARRAHAGQTRSGGDGMPYIEHPLAVAERLAERGFADEVLAAALLHDVAEETEVGIAAMREHFGDTVADLVEAMTEDGTIEDYEERKGEHRGRVVEAGSEALAIYAADKLTNVEMLRRAYAKEGEGVREQLKVPLDVKLGAWEADVETLLEKVPELSLANELAQRVAELSAERLRDARTPSPS
jgi:guanosine-3',5'-bis(diphosphate) 3'-pyrophosphohydrolase